MASPSKKSVYQIDEFIKQLMISQKFDELADIIADKAARKIKSLDGLNQSFHALRQRDNQNVKHDQSSQEKQNEGYRNENFEEKTLKFEEKSNNNHDIKDEQDSRSKEANNGRENNRGTQQKTVENTGRGRLSSKSNFQDRKIQQKEKFSKVDMETFLKTHMKSKELELNFKRLKDELKEHRFHIKQNKQNVKKDNVEKNNETIDGIGNKQEESNRKEITALKNSNTEKLISQDSKELSNRSDVSSNENLAHELSTFHGSKTINEETVKNSKENKSGYDIDEDKIPLNKKENGKPVPRNDELFNDSEDLSITIDENDSTKAMIDDAVDNVSEGFYNPQPDQSSKEIVEVGINRAISGEPIERYGKRQQDVNKNKRKKNVRVENGKQYAFQSSSEYAEYHEALAKEKKSVFL